MIRNFTLKVDKMDDWGLDSDLYIYNAMSLLIELNLRDICSYLYLKENKNE
jgi:hypothetical protein